MKRINLFALGVLYFILAFGSLSSAQTTVRLTNGQTDAIAQSNTFASSDSQNLLGEYTLKYRNNASAGAEILEVVHAKGLIKTAENVKTIRTSLATSVSNNEKIILTRILGSLYTFDDKTGMNNHIVHDLRGLANSNQKDIARSGVFAFSRLGYFTDSSEILKRAKDNGSIDTNEYFGELAHILPFAPRNEQKNLVLKIKQEKNQYAAEILAFVMQDPALMVKIDPETKQIIRALLNESEPNFSLALGEFGIIDSVRFSSWLHSIALLDADINKEKYQDIVFSRLNDSAIDPRKIMAFLGSTEGTNFIKASKQKIELDKLRERIALYSKQLPQNLIMRDLVREISLNINSLKS